jgi:hypothetical protein
MVAARYSGYHSSIGCEIDFRPSSDLVAQRKQDDEKSRWKLVEEFTFEKVHCGPWR